MSVTGQQGEKEAVRAFRLPVTTLPRPVAEEVATALGATDKDVEIGGAGLASAAIERGMVDALRIFSIPIVVGGGSPHLPPVIEDIPLDLIEIRTSCSRAIYERAGASAPTRIDDRRQSRHQTVRDQRQSQRRRPEAARRHLAGQLDLDCQPAEP
ncbi:MAG: dihydrofolate reductase family protein [Acidimicrobiales bacterium]